MTTAPDVILEGGYLPVSAELIEKRLNEIWMQGAAGSDEKQLVKLCLATILIVTDANGRIDAEHLAQQLATRHPSRILLIVIDEILSTYSAFVRTACEFDTERNAFVCWEIVEILSDTKRSANIAGAVRSLLIDSVPAITIDFRAFQSTPAFDADLHQMSDYYFVQAEVVPATARFRGMMPLSWYRTLVVRELLGTVFACLNQKGRNTTPREIVVCYDQTRERIDPLLAGWLIGRLADKGEYTTGEGKVRFHHRGAAVRLRWQVACDENPQELRIQFEDGHQLDVIFKRDENGEIERAEARYNDLIFVRQTDQIDLPGYILAATGNGNEFSEYAAVQRVSVRLPIP